MRLVSGNIGIIMYKHDTAHALSKTIYSYTNLTHVKPMVEGKENEPSMH